MADRQIQRDPAAYEGGVLFLETPEELPSREAVLRALAAYAPDTMAVFDVDLGHTDPQLVIPYGGSVTVDGPARRITVTY
jgi:muramoyltetrapeptide carboxypeptidase LdcA involved in peptidoglycan recycling